MAKEGIAKQDNNADMMLDLEEFTQLARKFTASALPYLPSASLFLSSPNHHLFVYLYLIWFVLLVVAYVFCIISLDVGSGVIDLGLDFPQKRAREKEKQGGKRSGKERSDCDDSSSKGGHQKNKEDSYQDNRSSQLCSFLFTTNGCTQGDKCSYKHADPSRATRGDKERIKKNLERMKRKDIDYNALK
jgi:hypothetical protein